MATPFASSSVSVSNPLYSSNMAAEPPVPLLKQTSAPLLLHAAQLPPVPVRVVTAFGMGSIFGFVLDRSDVMLPSVIRAQMVFTRQSMLKMWCSALGTTAIVFMAVHFIVPDLFERIRRARPYGDKGFLTLMLGGLIQGAGMTLTGACPGMVLGQIGSSIPDAVYTWVGCLIGALCFHVVHPSISGCMRADFAATYAKHLSPDIPFVDVMVKRWLPLPLLWVGLIVVITSVVLAFELVFPWSQDQEGVKGGRVESTGLLNPSAAGVAVGALQLPAVFLLHALLGTSAAYSVIVSQPIRVAPTAVQNKFSYSKHSAVSTSWWQIVYGAGAILGGYLSSSGTVTGPARTVTPDGVGIAYAIPGGMLLMFGARLAGGCASGHGLSGVPIFSTVSFVVVAFMWVGGIATGFILKTAIGDVPYYLNG